MSVCPDIRTCAKKFVESSFFREYLIRTYSPLNGYSAWLLNPYATLNRYSRNGPNVQVNRYSIRNAYSPAAGQAMNGYSGSLSHSCDLAVSPLCCEFPVNPLSDSCVHIDSALAGDAVHSKHTGFQPWLPLKNPSASESYLKNPSRPGSYIKNPSRSGSYSLGCP